MKRIFKYRDRIIESGGDTIIAGIVNVTPDSFSDGGKWFQRDKAVERALTLIEEGATMIDIGGESTRPGSTYVEIEEEINRVVPVIEELKKVTDVPLSIDTWKGEVAKAAIDAGVDIINDITGFLGDPDMPKVLADSDAGAILMFNPVIARPNHPSSKIFPKFGGDHAFTDEELVSFLDMDIKKLMMKYFDRALEKTRALGIEDSRIMLDPGIGFGLTKRENLILVNSIKDIHDKGFCAYLGVSRKRFIVDLVKSVGFEVDPETEEGFKNRDLASAHLTSLAAFMGTEAVRVHVVKEHLMAAKVGDSIRNGENEEDKDFGAYKK